MPLHITSDAQIKKDMETSQYLHSSSTTIPMEYDFHDLLFHDNAYMDAFMDIDEALAVDSPQQETHNLTDLGFTDLLLVGAEAVDAENWHLASATISRLDQLLLNADTDASPFLRLARFFAHGLRLRLLGPWPHPVPADTMSPYRPADTMSPHQMLQELSPYVKFAHFTANQAILEATAGERDVHVLDLDVMEGLQWPPLMADLAARGGSSLRITAVVDVDRNAAEVLRTGRRLAEFAETVGLALKFDELDEAKLEEFDCDSGSVLANCTTSRGAKAVGSAKKLSPRMVVLVQEELCSISFTSTFAEFFCEALQHFSYVSDSLASSFGGGYKKGLRVVEEEIVGPRIVECVSRCGSSLSMEGFRMVPLSTCNVSQAKLLVGLFSRGYGVQHHKGRLALCWKSRPLAAASVWVPN